MIAKFTQASRKDGTLVTVNLAQFDKNEDLFIFREDLHVDDIICLTIDNNPVMFRVNRFVNGKAATATTHCFPRYLQLPQVGSPVYADVTEIT